LLRPLAPNAQCKTLIAQTHPLWIEKKYVVEAAEVTLIIVLR
jgi:hypothetical protein